MDETILNAIRKSDSRAICDMFWDSWDVWSRSESHEQQKIVENWEMAMMSDAEVWLEKSDAWRSVAGKSDNISLSEFDAVVNSAIDACWLARVASALDHLRDERKIIETEIEELERVLNVASRSGGSR